MARVGLANLARRDGTSAGSIQDTRGRSPELHGHGHDDVVTNLLESGAMLALLVLLLAQAPAPPRVLVLETRAEEAYLPKVKAFGDLFATVLEPLTSAEIVPASSVKDRLSVASEKVAAGCDEAACLTELAGALDTRFVVSSRASQVGGRWLMRVELFDSQDLKVIAQVSAMSDSVEGLAFQAEPLADALLAKAPVLARAPMSTPAGAPTVSELPPPDAPSRSMTPWVVGGLSGAAAVAVAGVATWSFFDARGKEQTLNDALADYRKSPGADTRADLRDAGLAAGNAAILNNCVLSPLGCTSLPLLGLAVGGVVWGLREDPQEAAP